MNKLPQITLTQRARRRTRKNKAITTCVQCEDCKFANWDATLFRDHKEGRWEGGHYIPPYNEQFDVYCIKHKRFFLEQEITGDCQNGEYGQNNYHDVCKEHNRQIEEFKKALRCLRRSY